MISWLKSNAASALFARRSSGAMMVRMAGLAMVFVVQVVFARILGVDEYGVYIYVLTWMNVLLLPAMWGWGGASIKFFSIYSSQQEWGLLKGYLVASFFMPLFSALVLGGFAFLILEFFLDSMDEVLKSVFLLGLVLLPFNAILAIAASAMQGLKKVVKAQMPQALYRPFLLVGLVAISSVIFEYQVVAGDAMLFNIVSAVCVSIFAWWQLIRELPCLTMQKKMDLRIQEWSRVALPMLMVSGFALLMKQFDIVMLGMIVGTKEAGIYSVSSRIAELTSFGLTTINMVIAPIIAEQFAGNKISELQKSAAYAAFGVLLFTVPVAFVLIVFGSYILNIFGEGFSEGTTCMAVLVVSHVVNASVGAVGYFMTMTGHQKEAAKTMAGGALLNICLNLVLINLYGMVGAAIATGISMISWNMVMLYLVRKNVGVDTTVFSIARLIK